MRKSRLSKGLWIWALLAVLVSYSFDFECLLEQSGCYQQASGHSSSQVEADSRCAQPSLLPSLVGASIALLPSWTVLAGPSLTVLSVAPSLAPSPPPRTTLVTWLPLGLRAPPHPACPS